MPRDPIEPEMDDFDDVIPTEVADLHYREASDDGAYVLVHPSLERPADRQWSRPPRRPLSGASMVGWWAVAVALAVFWGLTIAGLGILAAVLWMR